MTATAMPVLTKVAQKHEKSRKPDVVSEGEQVIHVSLADSDTRSLAVDRNYIRVDQDATVKIKWVLDVDSFPSGVDPYFDRPGISFFGQDTTAYDWTHEPSEITVWWNNGNPGQQKRSFFYRVHVLDSQDRVYSTDPIVHNDPPSNA